MISADRLGLDMVAVAAVGLRGAVVVEAVVEAVVLSQVLA